MEKTPIHIKLSDNLELKQTAIQLAKYAQQAILYEAVLHPKPGLVDAVDNGAHKDMNIYTFLDSSSSLFKGFVQFAQIGLSWESSSKDLLRAIRPVGIELEKQMFDETKGINTHKGIIFSMGLFLAATGKVCQASMKKDVKMEKFSEHEIDKIFKEILKMTVGLVSNDFKNIQTKEFLTNGEKLYVEYGITGIRGEAEKGYPVVKKLALPQLRKTKSVESTQVRLLEVLYQLMAFSEDSNVLHRAGIEGLEFVQQEAKSFIEDGAMKQTKALERIEKMNKEFINKHISPGGSADLLSITVFLGKLEGIL